MGEYVDRKQYYINNRERIIERQKIYNEKNKERIAKYQKQYLKNKKKIKNVYISNNIFTVTF